MDASRWYWKRNGQKTGPLSSGQLRQLVAKGQLQQADMLLQEGTRQWVQAGSVKGLFKPSTPQRRPVWPWIAVCAATAILGGVGAAVILNSGKKEEEKPNPVAVKPADSDPGPSGKDDRKPEDKKPEDKKPDATDKKPPDKPTPDVAETLRIAEFQRFLKAGRVLHDANQFDAAVEAFTKAVNLNPDSAEAIAGLKAARDARIADLAKDRDKREEEQKLRAYRLLMENGQANVKRKQFDLAILAFNEALKLKPDDEDAKDALLAAEKAKKAGAVAVGVPVNPPPRPMRNPNLDAYRQRMAEGRTALFVTGQFDAAVLAFSEALKLFPDDFVAAAFLVEAQRVRVAAATLQAAQAQLIQRELWRGVELNAALAQGRNALANGNLDLAASAFTYAFQLAPNDPAVIQARLDLQQAQNLILARQGYQQFLRNGRQALREKRYNDAVNSYAQAVTLAPFDQATRELLQEATRLRDEVRTAANAAQQTAAQVTQLLVTGRAALARNDLGGASASFTAAQQLAPTDPAVVQAIQDLATARNSAQVGTDRQKLLAAYQQLMKSGQDAQAGKRYDDAIRSYREAARLVRGDKDSVSLLLDVDKGRSDAEKALKAQTALNSDAIKQAARVRDLLAAGRAALSRNDLNSAARSFNEAKQLAPTDADVQKGLQDLDAARATAQAGTDRQKKLASYQQLMKAGQDSQAAKRYQEAVRSFGDAARLVRGDKDSVTLLLDAERAGGDADKALKAQTAQNQDEVKRAARLRELLRKGRNALANFQFDSASKTLTEANNLAPTDADVQKALQEQDQARAQALKFDLRIEPGQVKLIPGMSAQVKVTVDRKGKNGFQGPIEFELQNLPAGVTANRAAIPAGQTSVQIQLSALPNTGLGTKNGIVGQGTVRGITGQVTSPAFAILVQRK